MKYRLLSYSVWLLTTTLALLVSNHTHAQSSAFVENKGQWPEEVIAAYHAGYHGIWIAGDRVRVETFDPDERKMATEAWHGASPANGSVTGHVYDMFFGSDQSDAALEGELPAYLNYFLGSDRGKWASRVRQYDRLTLHNVQEGIDVLWEHAAGHAKYTFVVQPGVSPSGAKVRYDGVHGLKLNGERSLVIQLDGFEIEERLPLAYQYINGEKDTVRCAFKLRGNEVGFRLGKYDKTKPLFIDPIIVASTYSGSTAEAFGHTATFDGAGNIYSSGRVFGAGYPTATGSFDLDFNGPFSGSFYNRYDVCISKYNPDGSSLIYATYLGGTGLELPHSIITNGQNQLHVLGSVTSTDFPTTATAVDTSHNGGQDIFITKFTADGSQLVGSTYLGGTANDGVNVILENYADDFRGEIVTDDSNQVYIASFTSSSGFPVTSGVVQNTLAGAQDGVVVKLNSNLSQLLFSTYLGSNANDAAFALKVGSSGKVYVSGSAGNASFPVDPNGGGANPAFIGGNYDAFALALNSTGSQILYSTFYGTTSREHAMFLELDLDENVYLYGWTNGGITSSPGIYQGPSLGSFITKLEPDLDTVLWECGFGSFSPAAFLVDVCSHIYVSGQDALNQQTSMTLAQFDTLNAVNNLGGAGFYLMALEPDASAISHGFFYGTDESHVDGGTSRFDKRGYVYQDVCDCSGGFPTEPWAYADSNQVTLSGGNFCDMCVFKVDFELPLVVAYAEADPYEGCAPLDVNFSNNGSVGSNHYWDFGDGSTSNLANPSHTFDSAGVYTVSYAVTDTFGCNGSDTTTLLITVLPEESFSLGVDTVACEEWARVFLIDTVAQPLLWSTGDTLSQTFTTDSGTVWLAAELPNCGIDTVSVQVEWLQPTVFDIADTGICETGFQMGGPSGMQGYLWSTGDTTQFATIDSTGLFSLTIDDGSCTFSDTFEVSVAFVDFGREDTTTCLDSLTLMIDNIGGQIMWNTGATSPSIVVDSAGTYWVRVENGFCLSSDTIDVLFDPVLFPRFSDTIVCGPTEVSLNPSYYDEILWSTGDTSEQTLVTTTSTVWVTIRKGACHDTDTFQLEEKGIGFETTDFAVCDTSAAVVPPPGPPGASYQWSTGDTTNSIVVTAPGMYYVTGTASNCAGVDSMRVTFGTSPRFTLGPDRRICDGVTIELAPDTVYDGFVWLSGGSDSSLVLQVQDSGLYIASMRKGNCFASDSVWVERVRFDSDSLFMVPNVMTPNDDGINDVLGLEILAPELLVDYAFYIYNRWGVKVFESTLENHDWDGRLPSGDKATQGIYFYLFEGRTVCTDVPIIEVKDHVTVIRE